MFNFFEHFDHASLLKDLCGLHQVLFSLSGRILNYVKCADNLVSLRQIRTSLTVQAYFQFLRNKTAEKNKE